MNATATKIIAEREISRLEGIWEKKGDLFFADEVARTTVNVGIAKFDSEIRDIANEVLNELKPLVKEIFRREDLKQAFAYGIKYECTTRGLDESVIEINQEEGTVTVERLQERTEGREEMEIESPGIS